LRNLTVAGYVYLAVGVAFLAAIVLLFASAQGSRPSTEFEARAQACLAEVRALQQQGLDEDAAYAEANTRPVCEGVNLRPMRQP
jgi:hypothetical protein